MTILTLSSHFAVAITLHGRYLTFHGSPDTCITITSVWDSVDTIKILYDIDIAFPNPDTLISVSDYRRHHVELNGLEPATRYYYLIQDDHGIPHTDIDSFQTAHPLGYQEDLVLLLVSDFQPRATGVGRAERDSIRVFVDTVRTQIAQGRCPHPDLILNLGDWISGDMSAAWDSIIAILDTLNELAPLLPTIGNHDGFTLGKTNPFSYVYHFNLPPSGLGISWMGDHQYVLDYQNIRFISLSMCDNYRTYPQDQVTAGSAQYNWLDSVLAATPSSIDHIIEMHHVNLLPLPWNVKNGGPNYHKTFWQHGIYSEPSALNTSYDSLRYEYYTNIRPLLETVGAISIEGHAWFSTATTNYSAHAYFGNLPIICCAGGNGWDSNMQSFCVMYFSDSSIVVNYHKVDTFPDAVAIAAGYPWQTAATNRIFTIYESKNYACDLAPDHANSADNINHTFDYTLTITNYGTNPDIYDLTIIDLPAGWTAAIRDTSGAPINSIGPLIHGDRADFCIQLTSIPGNPVDTCEVKIIASSQHSIISDTSKVTAQIHIPLPLPFIENFDHPNLFPSYWTIIDSGSQHNTIGSWHPQPTSNPNNWRTICDSDCEGSIATQDEQLISPVLDCTGTIGVYLKFWHHFDQYSHSTADVDISVNHDPWQNIISFANDAQGTVIRNISSWAAGQTDVRLRFHYLAAYDWWWQLDSLSVYSYVPERVEDLMIHRIDASGGNFNIFLQWASYPGATQYHIYKSTTDPQTGFILIDSTSNTTYLDSDTLTGETASFYYITADNESLDTGFTDKNSSHEKNNNVNRQYTH